MLERFASGDDLQRLSIAHAALGPKPESEEHAMDFVLGGPDICSKFIRDTQTDGVGARARSAVVARLVVLLKKLRACFYYDSPTDTLVFPGKLVNVGELCVVAAADETVAHALNRVEGVLRHVDHLTELMRERFVEYIDALPTARIALFNRSSMAAPFRFVLEAPNSAALASCLVKPCSDGYDVLARSFFVPQLTGDAETKFEEYFDAAVKWFLQRCRVDRRVELMSLMHAHVYDFEKLSGACATETRDERWHVRAAVLARVVSLTFGAKDKPCLLSPVGIRKSDVKKLCATSSEFAALVAEHLRFVEYEGDLEKYDPSEFPSSQDEDAMYDANDDHERGTRDGTPVTFVLVSPALFASFCLMMLSMSAYAPVRLLGPLLAAAATIAHVQRTHVDVLTDAELASGGCVRVPQVSLAYDVAADVASLVAALQSSAPCHPWLVHAGKGSSSPTARFALRDGAGFDDEDAAAEEIAAGGDHAAAATYYIMQSFQETGKSRLTPAALANVV